MSWSFWRAAAGVLAGILGPIVLPLLCERLLPSPAERRVYLPQSFVETSDALDRYLADHGRVPSTAEGLAALVPDYLPELPRDPWRNAPYTYEAAPDGQSAEVFSYGADGKPGGEGTDADLSLRALSMGPPPPPPTASTAWLVNLSFLLTPLAAFAGAYRSRFAAAALAGSSLFSGALLMSVALARTSTPGGMLVATAGGVLAVAGAVLVLRRSRGARPVALAAVILAWGQLALLAG